MKIDKLTYPEIISINGIEYSGKRNMSKGQILIPYTDAPNVGVGDVIVKKTDKRDVYFKVTGIFRGRPELINFTIQSDDPPKP